MATFVPGEFVDRGNVSVHPTNKSSVTKAAYAEDQAMIVAGQCISGTWNFGSASLNLNDSNNCAIMPVANITLKVRSLSSSGSITPPTAAELKAFIDTLWTNYILPNMTPSGGGSGGGSGSGSGIDPLGDFDGDGIPNAIDPPPAP